jgi:hypothetical protein
MLYSHGQTLIAGADPVLRNVERTSVLGVGPSKLRLPHVSRCPKRGHDAVEI